jgi:hypothetical protein
MSITFYVSNAPSKTLTRTYEHYDGETETDSYRESWAPFVNMSNSNAHHVCGLVGIELSEEGCGTFDPDAHTLTASWTTSTR